MEGIEDSWRGPPPRSQGLQNRIPEREFPGTFRYKTAQKFRPIRKKPPRRKFFSMVLSFSFFPVDVSNPFHRKDSIAMLSENRPRSAPATKPAAKIFSKIH